MTRRESKYIATKNKERRYRQMLSTIVSFYYGGEYNGDTNEFHSYTLEECVSNVIYGKYFFN